MSERPLILISNDDGVGARGIQTLAAAFAKVADIVVVAPLTEQSAGSHALTLKRPLRHKVWPSGYHSVDGTPADCIYFALFREGILPRQPDLVVSGINHGYNLGVDVFYSGTVAAAREAALRGFTAIAFSLGPKGSFDLAAETAVRISLRTLEAQRSEGLLLNVNFPPGNAYAGMRPTRLGGRCYRDEVQVRTDPRGKEYAWIGGPPVDHAPLEGSDTEAVDANYVTITPLSLEATESRQLAMAAWAAGISDEEEAP